MTADDSKVGEEQSSTQQLARALNKLTPKQVREVSPQFVRESYGPGEVIIRQGEPPSRFYIVIAGRAEVCHEDLSGETKTIDERRPGEYFGEIGLLQDRPRSATVRAPQDSEVEVLALEHQHFKALIEASRATEAHVAREMILRLIRLANAQS